jgi:hypothetical protein
MSVANTPQSYGLAHNIDNIDRLFDQRGVIRRGHGKMPVHN